MTLYENMKYSKGQLNFISQYKLLKFLKERIKSLGKSAHPAIVLE